MHPEPRSEADRAKAASSVRSGAKLALRLMPGTRARIVVLTVLGIATSLLDTFAIGVVLLLLQFAFGTIQPVQGYGALGLVANLAYQVSTLDAWTIGAIVLAILIAHSVLGSAYEGFTAHLRLHAYQTFREQVFANWVASDLHAGGHEPGRMVNAIQNETWEAADAVFQYCSLAIAGAIAAVYVAVMAATSVALTATAAVLAGLAVLALGAVRRRLWQRSQTSIEQKETLARHFIGNLNALRTIKAFRAESAAVRKSNLLSSALRRTFEAITMLETAIKPLTDALNIAVLGAVLLVAWHFGYPGTVLLGFVIVLYRAQPRILAVYQTLARLARSQPSLVAVAGHMQPPARARADGEGVFRGLEREIRLSAVRCAYPGTGVAAVEDLDLVIRQGEMTAIVGRSGAGKSTVVNLLLRFLEPQGGTITCDGVPIASYSRSSWMRRIAVAGQDVELIDGTIRENLLLGDPEASGKALWRALELADAADVARGLPGGLDAEVGSRGVSLSGGQRQRLCLARALLVDADLLVLDEGTNAVDAAMEQAILARIRAARPRLTLLVVAHRAAIARMAERVIVMAAGRAVESGPPEDLLQKPGAMFAALAGPAVRQPDAMPLPDRRVRE